MKKRVGYLALASLALTLFFLVPGSVLLAQVGTEGSILGVVTDPSGAVIAGAEVTVTNLDTGLKKTATTNTGGNFEILALPRGPYSVAASFRGFKSWILEKTELNIGERKRMSPVLEVGEITDKITVEAQAELIQTEKGSVENLVEEKAIRELPLNGRSPIGLVGLVPGMRVVELNGSFLGMSKVQGVGQRDDQTEFQLDGVSSTDFVDKGAIAFPSIETIAEFSVQTSNFTAENGSAPLQVLTATRAGTNVFHGSAWEFIRNDALDARNTFANSKPKLRQNQFGAVFGGPIVQDRTHFFGSYEGTRTRRDRIFNSQTPALAMFQGDFSSLSSSIRDPLTGQPFPGNVIPADRISSASKFFFPYILKPNAPGNLFRGIAPNPTDTGNYSLRVDQQITANQRLFGRLVMIRNSVTSPGYSPDVARDTKTLHYNAALSYSWNLNPTTLLTASAGYIRSLNKYRNNVTGIENLTQQAGIQGFGISPFLPASVVGLPGVSFSGYTGFGSTGEDPGQHQLWSENAKVGMNLIRAAHSISFGYQYADGHGSIFSGECCSRGIFDFNSQYTGDGFADYLLGLLSSATRSLPTAAWGHANSPYSALYFQDFWKLSPNLTVNLGVRYDYWHQKAFVRGNGITFDRKRGKVVAGELKNGTVDLTSQPISRFLAEATKGLWISATEAGLPQGLFVARGILTPRLGIAWSPFASKDLVVRGGYGLFPSIYRDNITASAIVGPPFFTYEGPVWSASQFQRWETAFSNDRTEFIAPLAYAAEPDLPNVKSHQWNVSIQKSLPKDSALTVSYVGNRSLDLVTLSDFNAVAPGQYPDLQSALPYPVFGALGIYTNLGDSSYHALQTRLERRFSDGLSFQLSYAFSKHIGEAEGNVWDTPTPFAPKGYNRGRSSLDRTHLLTVNGVWEVPLGHRRKYLNTLHPVANGILGGWQFSSIYSFSSGMPLSFGVPGATLGNGTSTRPNLAGSNLKLSNPSAELWFNPSALAAPPLYTFGNSGKGILDGPGAQLLDTALSKNFYIRETKYLQFRWEMFNALNRVNLGNPVVSIGQSTTGQIFSAGAARSMQFALKFVF